MGGTHKCKLNVGDGNFHANPYGDHLLRQQLVPATTPMQGSRAQPTMLFVDFDHLGVDADKPDVRIAHGGLAN
jgi:hypothetical protein